jgi:GNAT superfamily N-acetyltransferase
VKGKMNYRVVDYIDSYCDDVSNIVIRNLLEVNVKDYGIDRVQKVAMRFTPEMITNYSKARKFFVALKGETVVGTIAVVKNFYGAEHDYAILTVFVLPEEHGNGIGKLLIEKAEGYIKELSGKTASIPASITAHGFYNKLGYEDDKSKEPHPDGYIWVIKKFTK